jgi:hypothetical protein
MARDRVDEQLQTLLQDAPQYNDFGPHERIVADEIGVAFHGRFVVDECRQPVSGDTVGRTSTRAPDRHGSRDDRRS